MQRMRTLKRPLSWSAATYSGHTVIRVKAYLGHGTFGLSADVDHVVDMQESLLDIICEMYKELRDKLERITGEKVCLHTQTNCVN